MGFTRRFDAGEPNAVGKNYTASVKLSLLSKPHRKVFAQMPITLG